MSVIIFYSFFVILLLTGQSSAQSHCYNSIGCTGVINQVDDATDCCDQLNTDGQSYGVGPGDCEILECKGEIFP